MNYRSFGSFGAVAVLIAVTGLLGCGNGASDSGAPPAASIPGEAPAADPPAPAEQLVTTAPGAAIFDPGSAIDTRPVAPAATAVQPKKNYYPTVLIKTSLGDITVKLNAKDAPLTVENFLTNYTDRGLYDDTIVHFVQAGAMVAAGGFTVDHSPIESRGEILNEADNGLKNKTGSVAMYRHANAMNSAMSQFFFNLQDNPSLDHQSTDSDDTFGYCVFGEVIEGMDVLRQISEVEVHDLEMLPSTPATPVVIQSIQRTR